MIRLADPLVLLLWLLIPPAVYLAKRMETRSESSLRFSSAGLVKGLKPSLRLTISRNRIYLRAVVMALFILAAARPQSAIEETRVHVEGIDIVLDVDVSGSMRAMDFEMGGKRVNRLDVVKDVVSDFIRKRPNDRIGMVAFASLAYTVCPLTLDHDWLEVNLERVRLGMIEDGTAIGSAISAALNRLKGAKEKEKIIILLTDGRNNAGRISPLAAAEAAAALGVKIYCVGAGTKGMAPYPVEDTFGNVTMQPVQIEIDETLLRKIADITGGEYFRATDTDSLKKIYKTIDKLEKTPIEESGYNIYKELFGFVLLPALILLLAETVLFNTFFRRLP
ncbi:MAG: VWA domain-containing protein [Candidatus Omnitrophota bacterium]